MLYVHKKPWNDSSSSFKIKKKKISIIFKKEKFEVLILANEQKLYL